MQDYYRPLLAPPGLTGTMAEPRLGWCRIIGAEKLARGSEPQAIALSEVPDNWMETWLSPHRAFAGLDLSQPVLMGVLNLTPDSFSDGGKWAGEGAIAQAIAMRDAGAGLIDIGGESTRPGSDPVLAEDEKHRILPAIQALAGRVAVSVDTRKAEVAEVALAAGARIVNDVSNLDFDPDLLRVTAKAGAWLIIMHSRGLPQTMQHDPVYDDVLLDVYDALAARIDRAEAAGIPKHRIMIDPGIGFAKTGLHNLALLRRISLLHGLGCPILLGVSRKRFIGTIGKADLPASRDPGTQALTLAAAAQGVQMHRVHDVAGAAQALRLWQAVMHQEQEG